MRALLLTSIATLFLATGAAHAIERLPEASLGTGVGLKEVMSKTGTSKFLLVYLPRGGTVATV